MSSEDYEKMKVSDIRALLASKYNFEAPRGILKSALINHLKIFETKHEKNEPASETDKKEPGKANEDIQVKNVEKEVEKVEKTNLKNLDANKIQTDSNQTNEVHENITSSNSNKINSHEAEDIQSASKLAARAMRFGITNKTEIENPSKKTTTLETNDPAKKEIISRAARFGLPIKEKTQSNEKIQPKEKIESEEEKEKKRLRSERFTPQSPSKKLK